jgi:hypothetical protein
MLKLSFLHEKGRLIFTHVSSPCRVRGFPNRRYLKESAASVAVVVVVVVAWALSLLRGAMNFIVLLLFVDCI